MLLLNVSLVNYLHNDGVDGDKDKLDDESNEAHHGESESNGLCSLLEFCENKTAFNMLSFTHIYFTQL